MRRWIAEKIQVLNKEIKIENIDDIASAARKFIDEMGENCVFAFYGKMGAGKTTFIKAICEALGVTDPVASPTFAIVNEYADAQGQPIYHFDFYRIKNLRVSTAVIPALSNGRR